MAKSRRDFLKKGAVVAGATAVGSAALFANSKSYEADSNGVVLGGSNKKEILYKKTATWEEYYKNAK